jgi:hypothetical protein
MKKYRWYMRLLGIKPECTCQLDNDIKCGLKCKSCHEPIREKERWGKPTLCKGCEDAVNYGISWH